MEGLTPAAAPTVASGFTQADDETDTSADVLAEFL